MKQTFFRIISILLVLSLTLGGIAVPVWAEESAIVETEPSASEPTVTEPEVTEPEVTEPEVTEPEVTEPVATEPEVTEPEVTEPVVLPPMTTSDGHYIAHPSLVLQYQFPNNWSRAALEFCVGNKIMEGRTDGLAPNANITRAETAAILVRMLGAKADANALKKFKDVKEDAWYYDEVSAAVSVGLMQGTSETTINPNANLTREDACVLLCRAFGILPMDGTRYQAFDDAAFISEYAKFAISGMVEQGVVKGYNDNTFRPKANITRAELAKLVYEIVTYICDDVEQLPSGGRVLYRGSEEIPAGYQLYGKLILGSGYSAGGNLENVKVSNNLVISCAPGKQITLTGCQMNMLMVSSKQQNVSFDNSPVYLMVNGEGSIVDGQANQIRLYTGCTLEGGEYKEVHVLKSGLCLNLNGNAKNVYLYHPYSTVQGSGYAKTVDIYSTNYKVTVKCDTCTDHIYLDAYNSALTTVQTVSSWYNYERREPYSVATMEGYVNQKGYSSDTEYLIWVSTTTTTVNVFTGSKGNWKLVKSMDCALGAPWSPTVRGTFKTFMRDNEWDFGAYKCRWVTYFYNGYAFHSRKWSPDYSYLKDPSINCLVSAGCVRMYDEDCYYIYSEIPIRTTVVVY